MDQAAVQIAAKLALHEFLLEQIVANAMLRELEPRETWDSLGAELIESFRFSAWSKSDAPELPAIQAQAIAMATEFAAKVRQRIEQA